MGASVRARLLNLSRERHQPFDLLLTRYVLERLLYRLSLTPYRERFVLKGAMLTNAWMGDPLRPTRDVDFLGFGDNEPDKVLRVFRDISSVAADDGVAFDGSRWDCEPIRQELDYGGLRLKTFATVDGAQLRVIVDIGFGDATEPGITEIELPVLLDLPVRGCARMPAKRSLPKSFRRWSSWAVPTVG